MGLANPLSHSRHILYYLYRYHTVPAGISTMAGAPRTYGSGPGRSGPDARERGHFGPCSAGDVRRNCGDAQEGAGGGPEADAEGVCPNTPGAEEDPTGMQRGPIQHDRGKRHRVVLPRSYAHERRSDKHNYAAADQRRVECFLPRLLALRDVGHRRTRSQANGAHLPGLPHPVLVPRGRTHESVRDIGQPLRCIRYCGVHLPLPGQLLVRLDADSVSLPT
jgi:hypothetical protein